MTRDSKLSEHKRVKKQLKPPLAQLELKPASWIDDRLPEMLWAVLVVGNLERDKALEFFRSIAKFVKNNKECADITLSGIEKLPIDKRKEFIAAMLSWSDEIRSALRPLGLLPDLPAADDWKSFLDKPNPKEDWNKLANGVAKTIWHQSEAATDCRWIKFFCEIISGKLKFARSIEDIEESLRGVFEYPNYGDLRHIRPFIRAGEISQIFKQEDNNKWASKFWEYCYNNTGCVPEEAVNQRLQNKQKKLTEEIEEAREYYFAETAKLRNNLINHFFATSKVSSIDSRHEGAFGLALFGVTLFIELIFYRVPLSITGRVALRMLVEAYITLKYLVAKEKSEPQIWEGYRNYGTGQLKLIYLKLKESGQEIASIEVDQLDFLANEDRWIEFAPITLGHWDSENLRKISEEVGLKNIYDKYYDYTSGFVHANWGAIRESVYQKCVNPLHRYHRLPTYDLPLMSSVTKDVAEIVNSILDCLSDVYPKFDPRITLTIPKTSKPKKQKNKEKV